MPSASALAPALLPCLALLVGCGGAATPSPERRRDPGPNEWATLDFAARHEAMTFRVLPNMARRFAQHRGEATARLTCVACHGDDAEDVAYRMPNGLYPLDENDMPDTTEARWMAEVVVPLFDRVSRLGGTTTCFTCHEHAQ